MKKSLFFVLYWILGASSTIAAEPYLNRLGSLPISSSAYRMAVDESYVYLLLKNNSLIAIDISDPARPTEIARIDSEEGVFLFSVTVPQYRRALPVPNFAFEWPYIYYTDTIGLHAIDLRDPLNPVFGESVQLDYYIHEIDAFKNYLLSFVYDKRPYFSLFHPQGNFLLRDCDIPAPEDLTLYQIKDNYLIGVVMTMDGYRLEINEIVLPSMIRHFMNFQ